MPMLHAAPNSKPEDLGLSRVGSLGFRVLDVWLWE